MVGPLAAAREGRSEGVGAQAGPAGRPGRRRARPDRGSAAPGRRCRGARRRPAPGPADRPWRPRSATSQPARRRTASRPAARPVKFAIVAPVDEPDSAAARQAEEVERARRWSRPRPRCGPGSACAGRVLVPGADQPVGGEGGGVGAADDEAEEPARRHGGEPGVAGLREQVEDLGGVGGPVREFAAEGLVTSSTDACGGTGRRSSDASHSRAWSVRPVERGNVLIHPCSVLRAAHRPPDTDSAVLRVHRNWGDGALASVPCWPDDRDDRRHRDSQGPVARPQRRPAEWTVEGPHFLMSEVASLAVRHPRRPPTGARRGAVLALGPDAAAQRGPGRTWGGAPRGCDPPSQTTPTPRSRRPGSSTPDPTTTTSSGPAPSRMASGAARTRGRRFELEPRAVGPPAPARVGRGLRRRRGPHDAARARTTRVDARRDEHRRRLQHPRRRTRRGTPGNTGIHAYFRPHNEWPEFGQCVHKVARDAATPGASLRPEPPGVYRSDDDGATWDSIEDGPADRLRLDGPGPPASQGESSGSCRSPRRR